MKSTKKTSKSYQVERILIESHHSRQQNLALRDRAVIEEFNRHDARYIPITVIWREFIHPKFFISRQTLYRILNRCTD